MDVRIQSKNEMRITERVTLRFRLELELEVDMLTFGYVVESTGW